MRSFLTVLLLGATLLAAPAARAETEFLNVSYDPTRELFKAINAAFLAKRGGDDLTIRMSHGGSGSQARAVVDGLEADVVTLALEPDVQAIAKAGLVAANWQQQFPNAASPWTSTIVFVVRKDNPKNIRDWPDLVRPDVQIVTPNPKTSGNGKLSFLAAWGSVTTRGGSEKQALDYVTKLYQQVPVLDLGARGSTVTFVQRRIGDVHLTWENEAQLEVEEAKGAVEIVYPPTSILAQPPVAIVEANAKRKGTYEIAKAYLDFLYTPEGQAIVAKNHYRPRTPVPGVTFPEIALFDVTALGNGWADVNDKFFGDGKLFDGLYKPKK